MIHVPDEVAREITEDLHMAYRNGVGGVRTKENAELLEDLLEGGRPDLDELASEVTHARTEDIRVWTDIDRVEYLDDDLEIYTGEVD